MKHHPSKSPQKLVLSASALALSLLLSACGGGDATPPAVADTTPPAVTITDNVPGVATGDVTFTFTASEPLLASSFTASDVVITGGTKGALTLVSPTVATLVVTPTPNAIGTITIDLPAGSVTDLAGNATTIAATQVKQDYNTIPVGAGNTGACTTTTTVNCFNFDEEALAYEAFEGLDSATQAADPKNAVNKVGKFVKVPGGQPWAGATIYTTVANKSVSIIGLSSNKVVTLRVYSPAIGIPMAIKLEDASDANKYVTKVVSSTKANEWETLTFDFGTTLAEGAYNAATTYNKASFFPNFQVAETAARTYYIDELKYTIGTAPVVTVTPLVFASVYSATGSSQGGSYGQYADDPKVSNPWSGFAASEFYFGYHMNSANKAGYMGGFVKAPSNGTANITTHSKVAINVGGNPELFGRNPTLITILVAPAVSGCDPKIKANIPVTSTATIEYVVPKTSFTLENACGLTVDSIWASGVKEVHVQVPAAQMQYATSNANGYPNGLNIGSVTFQ